MTRIIVIGEASVSVPEGAVLVGEIGKDRRVATGQRRARGHGEPRVGGFRRVSLKYGRRAGDRQAHEERRQSPAAEIGGWKNPRRRKGDERREPGFGYSYASSRDPRVRALDRRKYPQASAEEANAKAGFVRYEPVTLGAAEKELRAYAAGVADEANAKAGFSGRSA